jgi:hypothetical protein
LKFTKFFKAPNYQLVSAESANQSEDSSVLLAYRYVALRSNRMSGHPVQARFKPTELQELDRWRRAQENPPTRGGALKELARIALQAVVRREDERASA